MNSIISRALSNAADGNNGGKGGVVLAGCGEGAAPDEAAGRQPRGTLLVGGLCCIESPEPAQTPVLQTRTWWRSYVLMIYV
jgi:hypothetical protein